MNDPTETLNKLLRLAVNPAAAEGEWQNAAIAIIRLVRSGRAKLPGSNPTPTPPPPPPEQWQRAEFLRWAGRRMDFGKYKYCTVVDVAIRDPSYLEWALSNCRNIENDLRSAMETALDFINGFAFRTSRK